MSLAIAGLFAFYRRQAKKADSRKKVGENTRVVMSHIVDKVIRENNNSNNNDLHLKINPKFYKVTSVAFLLPKSQRHSLIQICGDCWWVFIILDVLDALVSLICLIHIATHLNHLIFSITFSLFFMPLTVQVKLISIFRFC